MGNPDLVDGGTVLVPTFRFMDTDGEWTVENEGVSPDIEVLDDVTGNSIQDLAVVGRRDDTGQIRVQIRDASTGQKWKNIDLPVQ